jgi:hypothetical protein
MTETKMHPTTGTAAQDRAGDGGARGTAHDVADHAKELAESGREELSKVTGEVRNQTSKLLHDAQGTARERTGTQVAQLASTLGSLSAELDDMAAASHGEGVLAMLARDGATAMRSLSGRLERGGVDGVMADVRGFARRRPMVFLAGAFTVGLIAGRITHSADLHAVADAARDQMSETPTGAGSANGSTAAMQGGVSPAVASQAGSFPAPGSGVPQ